MGNSGSQLQSLIGITNIFQDIELSTAVNELKSNPAKLQQFLQSQQTQVYTDILRQKDGTFQKVYGDLQRAGKVQESVLMHDKRTKELANIQQQVYDNQKNSATAVLEDKNMAGRKNEMNEWSVGNKNDTLFVFSSLFIMLSGLLLITVLWRMSLIGAGLWVALGTPMIIIFILIVVNRSQYTDVLRNKRHWNKQIFEGKYGKIPIPMCPQITESIYNMGLSASQGMANLAQMGAQGMVSVSQGIADGSMALANSLQPNAAANAGSA